MSNPYMASFDPGFPCGYCLWDEHGNLLEQSQFSEQEMLEEMVGMDGQVRHIVYEDFRLLRHKALQQSGSRMEASQAIGILKMQAFYIAAQTHVQRPENLHVASMWSGVKMPSNHKVSHEVSAYLHGYYWLVVQGIVVPSLE